MHRLLYGGNQTASPQTQGINPGEESAVHLHLKEKGHSFEDYNVHVLDIYVKLEQLSPNRGGGLRHQLSATYTAVLKSLPGKLNHSSQLGSFDKSNSHDD